MVLMANTPPPAPPPMDMSGSGGQSQYDFFLKDRPKQRKGLNLGGGSFKNRLFIVAGGALSLLIILILFMSLVFGGSDVKQQLFELAQEQTEIVRVSDIGIEKARGSAAKNLATTVKYTVTSSRNDVLAIIKKKSTDKSLRTAKNSATDKTLESAATNNNFDAVFTETMATSLKAYQANIKKIYDTTGNQKTKDVLSDAFNSVNVLLEEPATQ